MRKMEYWSGGVEQSGILIIHPSRPLPSVVDLVLKHRDGQFVISQLPLGAKGPGGGLFLPRVSARRWGKGGFSLPIQGRLKSPLPHVTEGLPQFSNFG